MSPLRLIYLGLAIWGAVHPMVYFVQWFRANGWNLVGMIDAWHANAASSGLVWDLTISAIALSVFVISEVAVRRNWVALLAIPATFCIGVSCGLPLYLFLRSRPVR
ncbi:MAG: K+-transporting ATPase, A chain [Rhodobacteraceae bacterium]|nr:K+-transporting ATPase, A chain [Paracoccaceae bacterium]MAY47866.1 K+-transporting ATPase, A chain [Paracoccaceae bacterium]|tara:strand:- start:63 stop:380 length:318 start_codon:yes stop_codon:yes gene_type:complete